MITTKWRGCVEHEKISDLAQTIRAYRTATSKKLNANTAMEEANK